MEHTHDPTSAALTVQSALISAALQTLVEAGVTPDDYRTAMIAAMPCDAALLPLGGGPVVPCVKAAGHFDTDPTDLHETERGVLWADPDDGEG